MIISEQFAGITVWAAVMTGQVVDITGHGGEWAKGAGRAASDEVRGVKVVGRRSRVGRDETWVAAGDEERGPRSEREVEDFAKLAGRSAPVGWGAENPDSSSGGRGVDLVCEFGEV